MGQTRLYFLADKHLAPAIFRAIEAEFEEDGAPFAEVDREDLPGRVEFSLYADEPEGMEARLRGVLAPIHAGADVAREVLPDVDWVAKSLEGLKPVRAGRFLVHGAHDRDRRRAGDIAIEIEAGLAFGTGHHGTTAGCLAMVEKVIRRERPTRLLDLGTGSGVLAIAMARLSRRTVLATDIDPVATRVARDNARLNGVGALVQAETAAGFSHPAFARRRPFDLIVANILARPLMRLAPAMAAQMAPGGSLILSGILDRQRDAVVAAYAGQQVRHVRTTHMEGWVTLHLKR